MTIKLTTAVEHQLLLGLTDGIRKLHVKSGIFLDSAELEWLNRLAEDLPEDARNKLYRYCGERGLQHFVQQWIYRILRANYDYTDAKEKPRLVTIKEFADPIECARLIVNEIKALPHRFRVTAPLPRAFSDPLRAFVEEFRLSPHLSIVSGGGLPSPFPLETGNQRIDRFLFSDFLDSTSYDPQPKSDRLYLTACVLGSMNHLGTPIFAQDFEDIWRAFYGASMTLGILDNGWYENEDKTSYLSIHEEDDNRELLDTKKLDSDIFDFRFKAGTRAFVQALGMSAREAIHSYLERVSVVLGSRYFLAPFHCLCLAFPLNNKQSSLRSAPRVHHCH
jgi:hypothetical protein